MWLSLWRLLAACIVQPAVATLPFIAVLPFTATRMRRTLPAAPFSLLYAYALFLLSVFLTHDLQVDAERVSAIVLITVVSTLASIGHNQVHVLWLYAGACLLDLVGVVVHPYYLIVLTAFYIFVRIE
jgi:hypothetical protein